MKKFVLTILTAVFALTMPHQQALAAGKGMVKIVTTPGDARIFINGKRKGSSPSEPGQTFAIKLPEGEYVVEAIKAVDKRKEYYAKKEIFVSEDTLQTISLRMSTRLTEVGKKLAQKEKVAKDQKIKRVIEQIERNMVNIPGGTFQMGCIFGKAGKDCRRDAKPVHRVTVSSFYMGKYEVTFDQWDTCFADGGCTHYPKDEGWGRGNRPVINVSWDDAQQFVKWQSRITGQTWRLPTEAEWEYAARAGSKTKYSWGNDIGRNKANCVSDKCGDNWKNTSPVGSFSANKFGLYDMHGNVEEWVHDWYGDYSSSWQTDPKGPGSGRGRVNRGGCWKSYPFYLRSEFRGATIPDVREDYGGFRLVREP